MKIRKFTALLLIMIFVFTLAGCGSSADGGADRDSFTFKCVDDAGSPVEGVKLQACTDDVCMVGKSDASGVIVIEGNYDSLDVHVLKCPDGYEYNGEEEFTVTGKGSVTELSFTRN